MMMVLTGLMLVCFFVYILWFLISLAVAQEQVRREDEDRWR